MLSSVSVCGSGVVVVVVGCMLIFKNLHVYSHLYRYQLLD